MTRTKKVAIVAASLAALYLIPGLGSAVFGMTTLGLMIFFVYSLFTYKPPQVTDDEWHRSNQVEEDSYYSKQAEQDRIDDENRATQELLDRLH